MVRTSAPNSAAGLFVDENTGTSTVGTTLLAADMNNHQEEVCNAILGAGLTLTSGNQSQLRQAIVALSHVVGEFVMTEFQQTLGVYFPAVDRTINQDISSSHFPVLVPALRGIAANVIGVTSHSATVSGSTVTLPATASGIALTAALASDAIVSGWLNGGEDPGDDVADYGTVATRRTINVAGTDYAITGIVAATRVVTVSGTPTAGTQTVICYPYRIAGSSTTARLHKITGFVPVAAGDADGEVVGGLRRMDRGQGHTHQFSPGISGSGTSGAGPNDVGNATPQNRITNTISEGTNGTPRVGKTTDPRSAGLYPYTWAGVYVA